MKISYAVTVCNELVEIQRLLPFLIENKRQEDEIVIFYDSNNGTKGVEDYLRAQSQGTMLMSRAGLTSLTTSGESIKEVLILNG